MGNHIFHVELATKDRDETAKFFGDLFGWPITRFEDLDYTMTNFTGDEVGMAFVPVDNSAREGSNLIYIEVPDLDATIALAKELGAADVMEKIEVPTVGWMTVIAEPGGNRIAAMQRVNR